MVVMFIDCGLLIAVCSLLCVDCCFVFVYLLLFGVVARCVLLVVLFFC